MNFASQKIGNIHIAIDYTELARLTMSKDQFAALNKLASEFDGLPKAAYIKHLVERFCISEQLAAATVEAWLCLGEK